METIGLAPKDAISQMFGIEFGFQARALQIASVFLVAFLHYTVLLVSGTGTGKTGCLHGTAIFLRGITICIVPRTGLGSQQRDRANDSSPKIMSFHLDTIKDKRRRTEVIAFLLSDKWDGKSIILFVSPQTLNIPVWNDLVQKCIHQRRITSVFIDEFSLFRARHPRSNANIRWCW